MFMMRIFSNNCHAVEYSLNIDEISLNITNYLKVVKSVKLLAKVSVLCKQEMSSKLHN